MAGYGGEAAARSEGLIVERLPGELLVYDQERDQAHCLHAEAAAVFDLLDGTRTSEELAKLASLSEARVEEVLSELAARHLLEDDGREGDGLSRRDLIHTGAGVAGAALITSIVAPLPAAAQSPGGETCTLDSQECVGDCGQDECGCVGSDGVGRCVQEPLGSACQDSGDCPSGWYCANDPCLQTYAGGQYFQHCAPGCDVVLPPLDVRSRSWLRRR